MTFFSKYDTVFFYIFLATINVIIMLGYFYFTGCNSDNSSSKAMEIIISEEDDDGILTRAVIILQQGQMHKFNVTKEEVTLAMEELMDDVGEMVAGMAADIISLDTDDTNKKQKYDDKESIFSQNAGLAKLFIEGVDVEIRRLEDGNWNVKTAKKFKLKPSNKGK